MEHGAWTPVETVVLVVSAPPAERRMNRSPRTTTASKPMMIPDQATIERPSLDDAPPVGEQAFSVQAHSPPLGPITQTQSLQSSPAGRVSPSTHVGSGSGSVGGSSVSIS